MFERPNDQRGFLHKSFIGRAIGGAVKGFVTGGPLGGIRGGVSGLVSRKPRARPTLPRGARPTLPSETAKQLGANLKFGGVTTEQGFRRRSLGGPGTQCRLPAVINPSTGLCRVPKKGIRAIGERFFPGGETGFGEEFAGGSPVGDAVMGQFGAALMPGIMQIERSVCLPGMQLAKDGLCYDKRAITNRQRMWPRGRPPLLTGGDMRAIAIATRAGSKLERTTKRLRTLGMMKKLPAPRKAAAPHGHAKPVAAVSVS